MKRFLSIVAIASLLATGLHTDSVQAQDSRNCSVVESLGNALSADILSDINERAAGSSYRLNRRKTLVFNNVRSVSFRGCEFVLDVDVTLKRKIRRNAHGNMVLRGDISSSDLSDRQVCYSDLRVTDVNLSRTLRVGESVYRGFANLFLSNSGCLSDG